MTNKQIKDRLEYLRGEIQAEQISLDELIELRSLANYIEPGDVELLEWATMPEFEDEIMPRVGYVIVNLNGQAPSEKGAWGLVCDSEAVVYRDQGEAEEYARSIREENGNEGIVVCEVKIA